MLKIAKALVMLACNRIRAKRCQTAIVEHDDTRRAIGVFGTCVARCQRWEGHHGKHRDIVHGELVEW